MLSVATDFVVLAGKSNVYFQPLSCLEGTWGDNGQCDISSSSHNLSTLSLREQWKEQNLHVECLAVSMDGHLIAVADSGHGLHLFVRSAVAEQNSDWKPVHSEKSSKRVVKLQFTCDNQYLTFLDKQGDIFGLRINKDKEPLQVSSIKKLMGHTSFISDYITRINAQQIISSDRDEKIRISNFPDAFTIQGFKLGHTESVISMTLFQEHGFLLSASVFGVLILWDFNEQVSGTSVNFMKKWSMREVLPETLEQEVLSMKAISNANEIFLSLTYGGSTKISICKIVIHTMELSLVETVEAESDLILMEWASRNDRIGLVLHTPLNGLLKLWDTSGSRNFVCDTFQAFSKDMQDDIKELGELQKPTLVPMKKRQTAFEEKFIDSFKAKLNNKP